LATAYRQRFVYDWKYSAFRRRHHGSDARCCPPQQFVVCAQNHDQVGNRMLGERLSQLVPFAALKLAAATVLLSPYIPLLFMGEEYGETNPFLYFVNHSDADLIEAVRRGRKAEFEAFHAQGEPPDAASESTFAQSKLNWDRLSQARHQALFQYYQRLMQLRRQLAIGQPGNPPPAVIEAEETLQVLQGPSGQAKHQWLAWMNFSDRVVSLEPDKLETGQLTTASAIWTKRLDSAAPAWAGEGAIAPSTFTPGAAVSLAPYNVIVYQAGC
jgi:maltooligosyltrehalose trehalohydrolase